MRADGERLVQHISEARSEVILCAPFIKEGVLAALIKAINPQVSLKVITRWLPGEVALGVSDLEVFELIRKRENSFLGLMDNLHAKMYVSDERCLIGSANLTSKALGWAPASNIEMLFGVSRSEQEVSNLLAKLDCAREATYAEYESVREQAAQLRDAVPDAAMVADEMTVENPLEWWLPECAVPSALYATYAGRYQKLAEGVAEDARLDLDVLSVPEGLDEESFRNYVALAIVNMGGVREIVKQIPARISDQKGEYLVGSMRSDFDGQARDKQWQIIREWIDFFLSDTYEVAPESYVVRLRPKY